MSVETASGAAVHDERPQLSLSTAAARNLASTTKSVPQMQEISSRWLLRMLPWTQVSGGTYRVNRRLSYTVGDGRVTFVQTGAQVQVVPAELGELPVLRGFGDAGVLRELAGRFEQHEVQPGEVLAEAGRLVDRVVLIAHGKVAKSGVGAYGEETALGVLADGDHFGGHVLDGADERWAYTATAATPCTVLTLPRAELAALAERSPELRAHLAEAAADRPARNAYGESAIAMAAGHHGEVQLPGTFVDYEPSPREYELSVAQTVLRVHTRVADLYNHPHDQVGQQLRLTVEALRERQEHELVNNPEFGLLHNADYGQRIQPHAGPPTPDDMDELLSRRRGSRFFLAHPRAIAAFGRECSRRGLYPGNVEVQGQMVPSWRGVPILPCNKIPVSEARTSSVLVLRTGEDDQGVIGLHQTGIPDEYEPGLSVRFMGINDQAVISYLVSAYYSAAVLVPDALGVLENVQVAHRD
ncbi:cyclic nucleotide-binding domain-containing protein [Streptacidiphilus sp. ASG 303]|uniref:family 2B encapsulin nanocompartment shell protein n=1 Tax=Streptacidiphilus sp. ASG 303 TaxID=2896847 RepID=UPI001E504C7D|nr:family 2B encapsulin nanocompartment shell protein [Streptacidiphilus sp. ASG 303]MCD0485703.1 cyclic nucleotide-binding domain-containing protein [Streptacidiphilus sp. ASG 303]